VKNCLLLLLLSFVMGAISTDTGDTHMFKVESTNWAVTESAVYTPENLYDYINGGAEVYRAHGFVKLYAYRYENPGQPEILADVFEMADAADAYGVYHHDWRDGASAGIGAESELSDNTLSFRKNRYFVSLMAFDETEEAMKAVKAMAEAIAEGIGEDDSVPELFALLPEGMNSVEPPKFFHVDHCLNKHYFLFDQNVLNLDGDTDCTMAKYHNPGDMGSNVLLIVKYPSDDLSLEAFGELQKSFFADADEEGMVEIEDSKWAGSRVLGRYLVAVFDAATIDDAREMLIKTLKKLEVR